MNKIDGLEEINKNRVLLVLGRNELVNELGRQIWESDIVHYPDVKMFYDDYATTAIAQIKCDLEIATISERTLIITTQNKEFIDILLKSDLDFVLVRLRRHSESDEQIYSKIITKEDALTDRNLYNMELRK